MTPGLLTASHGQLLHPPTLLEAEMCVSSRDTGPVPAAGLNCLLAVPDAEGQREVRDPGSGFPHQPASDTACWPLCCSLKVSTWGARKKGVGEPGADKENKEDKEGLKRIYYMPSSAQDTDKHHYLYSLCGKRDIIY